MPENPKKDRSKGEDCPEQKPVSCEAVAPTPAASSLPPEAEPVRAEGKRMFRDLAAVWIEMLKYPVGLVLAGVIGAALVIGCGKEGGSRPVNEARFNPAAEAPPSYTVLPDARPRQPIITPEQSRNIEVLSGLINKHSALEQK